MFKLIRRGLAALWGGGAVSRREAPYFPEASRLFFLSPHLLTSEHAGRLTQPYREHVWVYACINAIAQSISSVPLLFKTGSRKDPQVVDSHPLLDLFEAPNPMMSGSQLLEGTLIYLGLTGEALYILDRRSEQEIPKEIWVAHPERFQEVVDEKSGLITGWLYRRGTKVIPLALHEVVFFRYFNPYNDYRGLSPLQAARAGVEQDYWAGRYNLAFFQNSAQPGGVLETSGNLTDEEYQRILAQWQDRHAGASKAHAIALLEGGLTYKQTGLSQKDMDFLEQRKWNREEIMAAFKVPKTELGLYEDVNYATATTQRKLFWETTLFPKMALIEYVLWSQFLRFIEGGRIWAEFDYTNINALQEDRRELVESAQKLWSMGVPLNVVNEYLGLGLPQITGGEVGYLPINLAPVTHIAPPKEPAKELIAHAADSSPSLLLAAPFFVRRFDPEAYWKAFLAIHTPLEKMVQSKVSRYFYEQRKRQLRKLEEVLGKGIGKSVAVEALLLDVEEENGVLKKMFRPLYLEAADKAAKGLLVELGADPNIFTLVDTPAMAAIENKLIKVVGINDTVRNQLRNTLIEGLGQMETTAELTERVKEVYNFAQSRALTIARTEVGQAMGIGRDAAMKQMDVEKIQWVTAGDEHVRPSHEALNGMVVTRGEQFPNGCAFPCDPNGPADEVINCRCVAIPHGTPEETKPVEPPPPETPVFTPAKDWDDAIQTAKELGYSLRAESDLPRNTALQLANHVNEFFTRVKAEGLPLPNIVSLAVKNKGYENTAGLFYHTPSTKISLTPPVLKKVSKAAFNAPGYTLEHEYGHFLHYTKTKSYYTILREEPIPKAWAKIMVNEVSRYASTDPTEFVAEVFRGTLNGQKYSENIWKLYRYYHGPNIPSGLIKG